MSGRAEENAAGSSVAGTAYATVWTAILFRVLFVITLCVAYLVSQILVAIFLARPTASLPMPLMVAGNVLLGVFVIVAYWIGVRVLERRAPTELSLRNAGARGAKGVLVGAALFGAVYAILWAAGLAHYSGFRGFDSVPPTVAILFVIAVGEEIIFRGVVFRLLENCFGTAVGLGVSAGLFGLAHGLNPNATAVGVVAIALEAGLLLGFAYIATRSLWFAIGIHFGWNFTQGGIFDAPISGLTLPGMFSFRLSGPDFLTGGAFGPEASVIAIAVCLVASVFFAAAVVRAGRWRAWRSVSVRVAAP